MGEFSVPHLDDRVLKVSVIPGEAIKPGMVEDVPNEGIPLLCVDSKGHLFIKFGIEFPESNWTDPKQYLNWSSLYLRASRFLYRAIIT